MLLKKTMKSLRKNVVLGLKKKTERYFVFYAMSVPSYENLALDMEQSYEDI